MKQYFDDVATLTATNTGVTAEAEADRFREKQSFDAWLAGTKIHMRWNGNVYVGNALGMEFTSDGPKII